MSYVLCESTWLENRNNAIKVLSWCIGNCSLATSFMERIENYILPPITSESLKRIRMTMIDCEKDRFQVADSLFALITSNHSCILWIVFNSFHLIHLILLNWYIVQNMHIPPIEHSLLQTSSEHNDSKKDALMELLLSFVKTHDHTWFSQHFYRHLMTCLLSTNVW